MKIASLPSFILGVTFIVLSLVLHFVAMKYKKPAAPRSSHFFMTPFWKAKPLFVNKGFTYYMLSLLFLYCFFATVILGNIIEY